MAGSTNPYRGHWHWHWMYATAFSDISQSSSIKNMNKLTYVVLRLKISMLLTVTFYLKLLHVLHQWHPCMSVVPVSVRPILNWAKN